MALELRPDRHYSPDEFWESRALLKAIKWWASDRVKSPYAILVWVMVQMLSRIPYNTFYVTKTGANSLNMTFNISGDTGTGKSASRHLASDPEKICRFLGNYWFGAPLVQPRSGEAIGDSYFIRTKKTSDDGKEYWEDDWVNLNRSVIFFFDEVLFLIGKQRQNSSTLPSVLLSMWSGEMLGGALAGGHGKTVNPKEYRACTVIHSQKENDPYRSDTSGYSGETSRVLNVRSVNPNARADQQKVSGQFPPRLVEIPRFGGEGTQMPPQFRALPEMEAAQEEQDLLASEGLHDKTRSHEILQRAKVACVLAALDGRTELEIEDWHLALHLIEHSRTVDSEIRAAQRIAVRSEAGKSGEILGIRMEAAEDAKEQAAIERVAKNIRKHAPDADYDPSKLSTNQRDEGALGRLKAKISSRDRGKVFDEALEFIYEELQGKGGEKNGE